MKVKEKKVEGSSDVVSSGIGSNVPPGMTIKDLSAEKRMGLYNKFFENFQKEGSDTFGMSLGVELVFNPRGVIPRMVVIDLLKSTNENQEQTSGEQEGK